MAGIKPGPGPGPDKLIFQYQYLLIEGGTQILRKLFDHYTGNDLMQYLNANPKHEQNLQDLIDNKPTKILSPEQKKILPPKDTKPNTSNFDITLLTCLLRNVCGLRDQKDPVWKDDPASGDVSVEADITRLRMCRNALQHKTTVTVSESEFQSNWNELVSILNRLSAVCGFTNLTSLIHDAEHKPIDDELKKQYDELLKKWEDMDLLLEDLKLGQKEILENQEKIIQYQSEVQCEVRDKLRRLDKRMENIEQEPPNKPFKSELSDSECIYVKERLNEKYLETCDELQVSPLFCEDDEVKLLDIYQPPDMCHQPYHRDREAEGEYPISSYKEVFAKDGISFRNIYITGDAGVGKSSFCQRMALLWSKSQSGDITDNEDVQRDIDYMKTFDFVFYVSLRDTRHTSIVKMIIETFFYTDSEDIMKKTVELIENILRVKRCLIILDGFDEWTPTSSGNETCKLPRKIKSEKCTYVTTCRPYKIESERLDKKDIDRQILMKGICGTEKYVQKIVDYVNEVNNDNKKPSDFLSEVQKCAIGDQLCIPIIASQLVLLWFDNRLTDMSIAVIYGNIIDMMLKRAVKDKGIESTSTATIDELHQKAVKEKEIESTSATTDKMQLPGSFVGLKYLQMHASLLEKVCSLSFQSLFLPDKSAAAFVFTEEQLTTYSIEPEEIDTLCKLGILSKNKSIAKFGKQEFKISFIHQSYLEFLAALFVYSFDKEHSFDTIANTLIFVDDIGQYENFFVFLTGISHEKVNSLLEIISPRISEELDGDGHILLTSFEILNCYQNLVLSCYKEACRSKTPNVVLKLEHFSFGFENILLSRLFQLNRMCVKSVFIIESMLRLSGIDIIDVFNCIKDSQLKHLYFNGLSRYLNDNVMKTFTCTVKTLPCIRLLTLYNMEFPDDVFLQLHPDVTKAEIVLHGATMSRQCFQHFIESCVKNKSKIKVALFECEITSFDGETRSQLSPREVLKSYMLEHQESTSTIKIIKEGSLKDPFRLIFEKTGFK